MLSQRSHKKTSAIYDLSVHQRHGEWLLSTAARKTTTLWHIRAGEWGPSTTSGHHIDELMPWSYVTASSLAA